MEYIKDRHPKAYLDILQKYIRFFISEKSMKELYKKEKERIESMPEFSAMKSLSHFLLKKPEQDSATKITQKIIKNASKNFVRQNFSIPMPIIRYMLTNGTVRQKNILYETCKQLFLLQPFPICCNITFTEKRSNKNCIIGQSLRLFRSPPPKIGNLFLTKTLTIDAPKSSTVLSKLICKIAKCEIWSLDVVGQIISWKNLQFLLEAETIKHFSFIEGKIFANDENIIPIEDVIEALPVADKIYLNSAAFTQNTFAKLAPLNRKEKFKYFEIGNVDCSFNFNDFENFVKEHFQPKAEIILRVKQQTSLELIRNVNQKLKVLLENWTSKETKPKITVL
uniref:Uncharacterized protein n=1 Tax=Panagrolaimus davidi TaxID=227884 RepID=A0A914QJE7_9BILA